MSGAMQPSQASGSKILRILGFSNKQSDAVGGESHPQEQGAPSGNPFKNLRRELMGQISTFLVDNDLDITPENLSIAHAAFTGSDLKLARKITERQTAREPVTQDWLNSVANSHAGPTNEEPDLSRLVAKLDSSIESFSNSTRNAHKVAANYGSELAKHAETMEESQTTGMVLTSLAELTKAMLERTQQVEAEMKRSEQEANSLRKSLAKAQRDAEIDHLTGLPNRRAFEGLLETNFREAQKMIEPLSVAFCDIDHFKNVNDTHGHDTGDRVIQAIGQVLARISNENCHVARHGGEEFVMLFRGLTQREAQERLDEARELMASRRFVNRTTDEPIGRITFSGGVADVFAFPDPRAALQAADEALYRAKQSGRNRIELA